MNVEPEPQGPAEIRIDQLRQYCPAIADSFYPLIILRSGSLKITSERSRYHCNIPAQFDLILQQMLKPVMVHCHKNKIGRLAADKRKYLHLTFG